ncbi:hypothetical protein IB277_08740 [Ensifer sp. ENS07]|jgi:hypothetical protein|nr:MULTISPECIES: hypothetical protein [Ensifer]MBD9591490.1 hypothetical protein [Ensifer sp. ENS05]MBD9636385.1 hypothetical protein [Ensifer sp. ENS07]UTV38473.1 hypothetical protein MYG64_09315 [Ensifer adhaerens]SDL19388.1 hypothetical protein SAMN05216328_101281 [Ensifer sp. YR511]
MQAKDEWRGRLESTFFPFATWVSMALVAAGTVVFSVAMSETGALQVLLVLVPFACALPAMISARLTVAFRRFASNAWQLLPLSAACGFVTVAGFAMLYALSLAVAHWNPSAYEPAFSWPLHERAAVIALLHKAATHVLLPAAGGALMAGISGALWLYREHQEHGAGETSSLEESHSASPSVPAGASALAADTNADARYFWSTTVFGPVIVAATVAVILSAFIPGSNGRGSLEFLWFVLRLYSGGTFAAAVAAALMLVLMSGRSRAAAWPVALCVGLHAGAIFLLLFAPAEGHAESQQDLLAVGGILGALSAAACAAIWFPARPAPLLGNGSSVSTLSGWWMVRTFSIAGLVAPLTAALAYALFVTVAQEAAASADDTLIGRLRSFDPEMWAIAYRIWAVVALQTLALDHFLPSSGVRRAVAFVVIPAFAFLFAGSMGHCLDDYVMSRPMPISIASFIEFGLPGLFAGLSAVYLSRRGSSRGPAATAFAAQ